MLPRRAVPVALLGVLAVVTIVHLAAVWTGTAPLVDPTRWLLMPLLAAALLTGSPPPRGRLVRLTALALGFSWLGDTAPDLAEGTMAFLVLVGFFLVAQVIYVVAFWPYRADSVAVRGRWLLLPYLAAIGGLVVTCAPGAGPLLVPVLVYGLCLGVMAVLATGLNPVAAVGGALFLVSDGLIAVKAFAPEAILPRHDVWVMLTYVLAQVLLVAGVLAATRPGTRPLGSSVSTGP